MFVSCDITAIRNVLPSKLLTAAQWCGRHGTHPCARTGCVFAEMILRRPWFPTQPLQGSKWPANDNGQLGAIFEKLGTPLEASLLRLISASADVAWIAERLARHGLPPQIRSFQSPGTAASDERLHRDQRRCLRAPQEDGAFQSL